MVVRWALAIAGSLNAAAPADHAALAEKIFQYLGFTAEDQAHVGQGQIVSHGLQDLADKELALAMAMVLPVPLDQVIEFGRSEKALELNRDILSHGFIDAPTPDAKSFQGASFTPSETGEIAELFFVKPGSKFNLSTAEIQKFMDLRGKFPAAGCKTNPDCTAAVGTALQEILWARVEAYRARGLAGIEPYAREGDKTASPADELRGATNEMKFLAREYPQIHDAFLKYPKGDQAGVESRFLWRKEMIQDRATFILAHRFLSVRDDIAFAVERQFYVGHSYNSLQIVYGLVPTGDKTLVFYVNRTFTDQVAGLMSGTRHSMGKKIMEKEVRGYFEQVRAHFGAPKS